jgi:hypothetical protein
MKVLVSVSAYACGPGEGSETGAGWAFAQVAATRHDVWLLTQADNEAGISKALQRDRVLRLTPIYLEAPRVLTEINRRRGKVHPLESYIASQWKAGRLATELHRREHFHDGHHVTSATVTTIRDPSADRERRQKPNASLPPLPGGATARQLVITLSNSRAAAWEASRGECPDRMGQMSR